MRICVYGAGAVGSYLAARLGLCGAHELAVCARGAALTAIAAGGITLHADGTQRKVHPQRLGRQASELGLQDLVFVTTKAHAQADAAKDIAALLAPGGCAVFVCNGVPWWWHYRGRNFPGESLPLLDPQRALWDLVRPQRALGCVVYSANELLRPGVVQHLANDRWMLGEPDGSSSPRVAEAVQVLRTSGLTAEVRTDLRADVWRKLMRNAALNPLCALTRLAVEPLLADAELRHVCSTMMREVAAVAAALGHDLHQEMEAEAPQAVLAASLEPGRRSQGAVRPSMLQDVLQQRRTEVDAILGQVQRFARAADVSTPTLDLLLTLMHGLERG